MTSTKAQGPLRPWMLPVGIVVVGLLELVILMAIGRTWGIWTALLVVAVGVIAASALVVAAGQQSFARLASLVRALRGSGEVKKHMSRPAFTLLAAACFFFPGVLTDIAGIVLLFTPVQRTMISRAGLAGGGTARRVFSWNSRSAIEGEIIIDAREEPSARPNGSESAPH